jgi:hypothetical protein
MDALVVENRDPRRLRSRQGQPRQSEQATGWEGVTMHIEISTDNNISGSDGLASHIRGIVEKSLAHFADQITRVEVHLSDANAGKSGQNDIHCMMEARLEGRQPTAATHAAETLDSAAKGAADKLKRSLESALGRLRDGH